MKTQWMIGACAALLATACTQKQEMPEAEATQLTIRAYQEGSAGTRTLVQDGGTQVLWEPADEIKVFFKGTGGRFVSQNTEAAAIADFSGTLNMLVGGQEGAAQPESALWGLYPYRADATSDGNSVTTTLPASQTGRAGSFAKDSHISLACRHAYDLAFYNVCGGVRFSLTQEGIKRVTFRGNKGETLAGRIRLSFEGGVPAVQEVSEAETLLTLTAPEGGTFEAGKWYYLEALPGTLSQGYTMTFYKENEYAELSSSGPVTFRRGVFGSLPATDEGLTFQSGGSHETPDPEGIITFADPIAKYACVEKFDSNGDGELSYAEAAAVTSLSGLFTDWNIVTQFDELQYFTGVTSTENVFTGLKNLEHITIPAHIRTLGSFENCTALTSVSLPDGLTELPTYCFYGCTALAAVRLPEDLSALPNYCFDGCTALSEITLPSGITVIPGYCFRYCSALSKIALPAGIKTIGGYGFYNCISLSAISLPSGLQKIGNCAFRDCSALTAIEFPASLTSIGQNAFSYAGLVSLVLPNGVSLGDSVFEECRSLASVVLPADMTALPSRTFFMCRALSSVTWPDALQKIGDYAFDVCGFEKANGMLRLPETVASIGKGVFSSLRHLVVPSPAPVSIDKDAFGGVFTQIYVPAGMVEMYKVRTNWSAYATHIHPLADYPVTPHCPIAGAVDMGLSVKWASWNVGASAPEDYGDYFAWGETSPTVTYNWSTYKYCMGSFAALTKYCDNSRSGYNGFTDNKTVLDLADDAARANWGGSWRMPTEAEWRDLMNTDNCTWTWTTQSGTNGYKVTSKKTGNSIFLPAAGYRDYSSLTRAGSLGYYWSSSLNTDGPYDAYNVFFNSLTVYWDCTTRYHGQPVRPVTE